MPLVLKPASLFLVALFCSVVEGWIQAITTDDKQEIYEYMGFPQQNASEAQWKKRFDGEGIPVADALDKISFEKKKQFAGSDGENKNDHLENTEFIIFASLSDKGGSLFSAVPKLVEKGYKKFTLIFIINYYNPTGPEVKVCCQLLKDIENLANETKDASIKIQRFHTSNNVSRVFTFAQARRERTEEESEACLSSMNINKYGTIATLDDIIRPGNQILVDGLLNARFKGFDNTVEFETPLNAVAALARAAKSNTHPGLTVVANVNKSGMHYVGDWKTPIEHHFTVHVLLSMGWMTGVVNGPEFKDVQMYWLFFKMDKPNTTFFQAFHKNAIKFPYYPASMIGMLPELIKMEQNQTFALVDRETGKAIPAQP